jgi:hypothetical protein
MPVMIPIATVTVGSGGASTIDFTSIPQTYTDLLMKVSARSVGSAGEIRLEFNGITTSYSGRFLQGNGSAASSGIEGATHSLYLGENDYSTYTANTFTNGEFYIPNYTSSNYKSVGGENTTENNATQTFSHLTANLWSNTAAITSIKIKAATNNFAQYSTATLYGI